MMLSCHWGHVFCHDAIGFCVAETLRFSTFFVGSGISIYLLCCTLYLVKLCLPFSF